MTAMKRLRARNKSPVEVEQSQSVNPSRQESMSEEIAKFRNCATEEVFHVLLWATVNGQPKDNIGQVKRHNADHATFKFPASIANAWAKWREIPLSRHPTDAEFNFSMFMATYLTDRVFVLVVPLLTKLLTNEASDKSSILDNAKLLTEHLLRSATQIEKVKELILEMPSAMRKDWASKQAKAKIALRTKPFMELLEKHPEMKTKDLLRQLQAEGKLESIDDHFRFVGSGGTMKAVSVPAKVSRIRKKLRDMNRKT